jgi:hypothetical protein
MPMASPANPVLNYRPAADPPGWVRFFMRHPGWPFLAFTLFCCGDLLWAARLPDSFMPCLGPFFATFVLLGWWGLRMVVRLVLRWCYPDPPIGRMNGPWKWWTAFFCLTLTWAALLAHLPLAVTWQFSEPAMRREAEAIIAAHAAAPGRRVKLPGRHLGAYWFSEVWHDTSLGAVTFFYRSSSEGWTYARDRLPAHVTYDTNDGLGHEPFSARFYHTQAEY